MDTKTWVKKFPKVTALLILVNVLIYLLATNFYLGSPSIGIMQEFSFDPAKPYTIFTYMFMHVFPAHLAINITVLAVFGALAEPLMRRKEYLAVYFICGAAGAIFSYLSYPTHILLGASAAVFGIIGAATVLRPQKTILAFFGLFVILYFIVHPVLLFAEENTLASINSDKILMESSIQKKVAEKEGALNQISNLNKTSDAYKKQLEEIEEKYQKKEISASEFLDKSQDISSKVTLAEVEVEKIQENATKLEEQIQETEKSLQQVVQKKTEIETAKTLQTEAFEDKFLHIFGLNLGAVLLFLLRKETFEEWKERYESIKKCITKLKI